MSVKMMSLVFDRFPYAGNDLVLALALADHAHDDGTHIYPGHEALSKKSRISERTVIRLIQKFVAVGWLIKTSTGNSIRGVANTYKINPNWITGDNLSPQINEDIGVTNSCVGVTNETVGVTPQVITGDIAMSHQPSLTIINHQETTPREKTNISEKPPMRPEGLLACRLIKLNVTVTSMHPVLCKWVADNVEVDFIEQCIALARQNKPWPEKIAAGYLDAIIRNELKPKSDNSWLMTDEATIAKGRELRIEARAGESMGEYRARLRNSLGLGGNQAAA
jgi:hypothetical protein